MKSASSCSQIPAAAQTSYISSTQAEAAVCTKASGVYDQEFSVTAKTGQKIHFSLINLEALFNRESSGYTSQQELGYILDSESDAIDPIVQGSAVEHKLPLSRSHQASIFLSSNPASPFLIGFQGM